MTLDAEPQPTRRTLLAGGLGGLIGLLGSALARPTEAAAATDAAAVHKGVNNPTTAITKITSSGSTAFIGRSASGGANRAGVFGSANGTGCRGVQGFGVFGVFGESPGAGGRGVQGLATSASGTPAGVFGHSRAPGGVGVFGKNIATAGDAYGVRGESSGSAAVHGRNLSTAASGVRAYGVWGVSNSAVGSGVHGDHDGADGPGAGTSGTAAEPNAFGVDGDNVAETGSAVGVRGRSNSPSGFGVLGRNDRTSGSGSGVKGVSKSHGGFGVNGVSESTTAGVGVYGSASSPLGVGGFFEALGSATALEVAGPARFQTSGIATIPSGQSSVSVTHAAATSTSIVLCTLLSDAGASVLLKRVSRANGSFQIILNANAASDADVAWLLLEN